MQQVGRYLILGELGRGAMGVVYRAQDPAIGRTIAIKTIRLSDLTDAGERERLRDRLFREAQSAGILSHPNIVTIYDILEESGLAYIFMEFVNGPPLENLLSAPAIPEKRTLLSILRQTAAALDYAHKKGIVHRDIKPGNIMIHDDGSAKITDFGVAKILSQQMTQAGTMMGTPSYMSPEQVQGTEVSGRADQFSLAVIAYEMLTGEKPFVGEYLPSLLYKICREDPAPAHRLNTTLGAEVDAVLRKGLAKAAGDRYPTCADLVAELELACDLRPNWIAFARGAMHGMPTLNPAPEQPTIPAPVDPSFDAEETVAAPPGSALFDSGETIAAPAAPVETRATPPPRLLADDDGRESHLLRNAVLAAAALLLIGGGYALYRDGSAPAPPPAAVENQPPAAHAEKPSPTQDSTASQPRVPPEAVPNSAPGAAADPPRQQTAPARAPEVDGLPALPTRTPGGLDMIVRVITSPPGAQVIMDNSSTLTCVSPCSLPLPQGRHAVVARLEGYRDLNRIIEVPRDSNVGLDLERQAGTLSVSSSPPGAAIILNGEARPERTPAVLKLPAGSYRLQVVSGSVKTEEETVSVRDGVMSQRKYTIE